MKYEKPQVVVVGFKALLDLAYIPENNGAAKTANNDPELPGISVVDPGKRD